MVVWRGLFRGAAALAAIVKYYDIKPKASYKQQAYAICHPHPGDMP